MENHGTSARGVTSPAVGNEPRCAQRNSKFEKQTNANYIFTRHEPKVEVPLQGCKMKFRKCSADPTLRWRDANAAALEAKGER